MLNPDKPYVAFVVLESHGDSRQRQDAHPGFGPLDEHDGVVEVRLEIPPLGWRDVAKAEEIEVRDVHASVVAVPDRVRRTRHRPRDSERTAGAAHEGGLAGAELAGDGDDVARPEVGCQLCGELFGLGRRARLGQKRPSWTAGSAERVPTYTGSVGGATSRPSNSGNRAKSDFSTSSIRGV